MQGHTGSTRVRPEEASVGTDADKSFYYGSHENEEAKQSCDWLVSTVSAGLREHWLSLAVWCLGPGVIRVGREWPKI